MQNRFLAREICKSVPWCGSPVSSSSGLRVSSLTTPNNDDILSAPLQNWPVGMTRKGLVSTPCQLPWGPWAEQYKGQLSEGPEEPPQSTK